MGIYLLLFLLIVGFAAVVGYAYYLREKNDQLKAIYSGICPICGKKSVIVSDRRGGGCGPKLISYRCTECGYQNSFSIEGGCSL